MWVPRPKTPSHRISNLWLPISGPQSDSPTPWAHTHANSTQSVTTLRFSLTRARTRFRLVKNKNPIPYYKRWGLGQRASPKPLTRERLNSRVKTSGEKQHLPVCAHKDQKPFSPVIHLVPTQKRRPKPNGKEPTGLKPHLLDRATSWRDFATIHRFQLSSSSSFF